MKTASGCLSRFASRLHPGGDSALTLLSLALVVAVVLVAVRIPEAAALCCAIVGLDRATGLVTAKETATGRTFQFKVADPRLVKSLTIGQPVAADFSTMQAHLRVSGAEPINGFKIILVK